MPRAEEGIFLGYTDTSSIYKVHIPAHSHTFMVSTLDVKFKDTSMTMSDVIMLDVNSANSTTVTLISFVRLITGLMPDSQQQSL